MKKIFFSAILSFLAFSGIFSQVENVFAQAVIDVSGGTIDPNPMPPMPSGDGRGSGSSGGGAGSSAFPDESATAVYDPALNRALDTMVANEQTAAPTAPAAGSGGWSNPVTAFGESAVAGGAGAAAGAAASPAVVPGCGLIGLECALIAAVKWIALGILWLFGWLLWVAGGLFDGAIKYLVIGMGGLVVHGGFGGPIEDLWKIIRDLVNITFLFALIYTGLSTILNGSSASTKERLKSVIISALLVNFSLYFAKVVIDIANLTADTIYRAMQPAGGQPTSLSSVFMRHLKLETLMLGTKATDPAMQRLMNDSITTWAGLLPLLIYAFGGSILMFKLTFAFALGAFLLVLRFIMLIVLMIFSPIAFLPSFLPGLGSYSKQWWDTLLAQSFLAPLFLFGIYMTLKILASIPGHTSGSLLSLFNSTSANGGWEVGMKLLLFYMIAIVMIVGTTIMAKSMSSQGASFAVGATGWVDKKLKSGLNTAMVKPFTASARAGASYVGRNTAGRASRAFSKQIDSNTWAGKLQRSNMLGVGRIAQEVAKKGTDSKYGGWYSHEDDLKEVAENKKRQNTADRKDKRKKDIAAYQENPANMALRAEAQKTIRDMTNTELEQESVDTLKKIAGLLSDKQVDHIKDHKEKFTPKEKGDLVGTGGARESEHLKLYENAATADDFLKTMKPQEIAKLSTKILLHATDPGKILEYVNGDVMRKIHNDNTLSPADAKKLSARIMFIPGATASAEKYINSDRGKEFYPDPATLTVHDT